MAPGANPFTADNSLQGVAPSMLPPPETRALTPREQQLLERRKNWVFMTPEELLLGDSAAQALGLEQYGKDAEKQSMTPMERYYQNLMADGRNTTTNRFDKDSDPWGREDRATNTLTGAVRNGEDAHPFDSPFNSTPAPAVFQPMRPNTFSDVFGTGPDTTDQTPESIAAEKEEKAHMDSFKQLWDIGQPSASAGISDSTSTPSFPGSESSSAPSLQPVLGTASPGIGSSSAQPNTTSSQPVAAPSRVSPPRPNFTIPQRPF